MVQVIDLERKLAQASGNRELGEFLLEGLAHWFDACGILLIKSDMLMGWQAMASMEEATGTFEDIAIGRGESSTIERIIRRKSFYAGPWPEDFFIHPLIRAWRPPVDRTTLIFPITVMGQVRMIVLGWSSLPMGPAIHTTIIELLEKAGWRFGDLIMAKKKASAQAPLGSPQPPAEEPPPAAEAEQTDPATKETPEPEPETVPPETAPAQEAEAETAPGPQPDSEQEPAAVQPEATAVQKPETEEPAPPSEPAPQQAPEAIPEATPTIGATAPEPTADEQPDEEPAADEAPEEERLPVAEDFSPPAPLPEPEAPKARRVPEMMLPDEDDEIIADESNWSDLTLDDDAQPPTAGDGVIPHDAFDPIGDENFNPYEMPPEDEVPAHAAQMTVELTPEEAAEMVKKAAEESEPEPEAPAETPKPETTEKIQGPKKQSVLAGSLSNWSQVFKATRTSMQPAEPEPESPVFSPEPPAEPAAPAEPAVAEDDNDDGIPIEDIQFIPATPVQSRTVIPPQNEADDADMSLPPPDNSGVSEPETAEPATGENLVASDEVIIQAASSSDLDILTRENVMPNSAEKLNEQPEAAEVHSLDLSGEALESQTVSRRERAKTLRMYPEQETAPKGGYISDSVGNHGGKAIDWTAHIPVATLLRDRARYLEDQHSSTATLSGYRFNDDEFISHLQSLAQDEASTTIRSMLDSDNVFERFYGAYAASVVYGPGIASRLIDLLYDDDDAVMTMASRVLLTRRGDADFEEFRDGLLEDLKSDDVENVLDAIFMLGMIKDPLAVRPLMSMLETIDDPRPIIDAMTRISCQYPGGDKYAWQAWWRANRDLTQSEWFIFALTRGAPALAREAQACLHALHGNVVAWANLDEPANRADTYDRWREFWNRRNR